MAFTNLPSYLVNLAQQGYLEKEFQMALSFVMGYRLNAARLDIPGRIGSTYTETRLGRKAPAMTPISASNRTGSITNGITPTQGADEQWTFTLNEYADAIPLNLTDDTTIIKSQFLNNAKICGEQGSQTLEWLCRNAILNAYMQGDTYVLGSGTTNSVHVNDIRGFQNVMVNGNLVPVSAGNPLTVQESGTTSQSLTVISATADGSNVSTAAAAGGVSGILTFNTATAPTTGDRLLSASASVIIRPNGAPTTLALVGGSTLKLQNILDAVKTLRKQNVPTYPDGTYHCVLDDDGIVQLFGDPRFQVMYEGAYASVENRDARIFRLAGCTFIPTTEAVIQAPTGSITQTIHRAVVMGYEGVIQGNFAGLRTAVTKNAPGTAGDARMVDDLCMVTRAPIDTLLENITQGWKWIGDFECPSDSTTNPTLMPTANNALFKRIVVIEYVG